MNEIEKKLIMKQLMWLGIGLAISMSINFAMFELLGDSAFPWNIIVTVGVLIALAIALQRRMLRQAGLIGRGGGSLEYICYRCGNFYKGGVCPRCGAKGGKPFFKDGRGF